jgi:hypothetical protein
MKMKLRVVLALCGLSALFLLPAVYAQEGMEEKKEAPKGPQLDEMSKKLLGNWEKSTYHLGRLGVKKASCKAKFTMNQMGQEMGSNLTYKWDGKSGKMEWDNPQMGAMFAQGGFQERFDADFKNESFETQLGTAKCTAQATETGHVVTVDGKTKSGAKSFTFDKDGVLTQLVMEIPGRMGGTQKLSMKLAYTKVAGKYLVTSQTGEMDSGMGMMGLVIKFTYAEVGGYQVKQKQVTNVSMGGNPMGSHILEFSDWKFNEAVDAPPAKKPAESDKGAGN